MKSRDECLELLKQGRKYNAVLNTFIEPLTSEEILSVLPEFLKAMRTYGARAFLLNEIRAKNINIPQSFFELTEL